MKILTVSALVCALMALTTADGDGDIVKRSGSCNEDPWTFFDNRCFAYVETPATWADAEKYCKSHGGHLPSVHFATEGSAIQGLIKKWYPEKPQFLWLGGSYSKQNGKWFWSDGSSSKIKNWAQGQPDYRRGSCVAMNNGGKFYSQSCNQVHKYFCARNA